MILKKGNNNGVARMVAQVGNMILEKRNERI